MASVVPVYFVQIMPEVFNFSLACLAYFCWLYKEVATPERSPRGTAWLFTPRSDLVAGGPAGHRDVLQAVERAAVRRAGASLDVPPEGLPELCSFRLQAEYSSPGTRVRPGRRRTLRDQHRDHRRVELPGGRDRKSYVFEFPFQTKARRTEVGAPKSREDCRCQHVIFNPRTFGSNLTHNLEYFFIGRYAGHARLLLSGHVRDAGAFLAAPRSGARLAVAGAGRRRWRRGCVFVIATPYTWSGGGVGNRYFFAGYGVMLFLLPPIESIARRARALGRRRRCSWRRWS